MKKFEPLKYKPCPKCHEPMIEILERVGKCFQCERCSYWFKTNDNGFVVDKMDDSEMWR